VDWDDTTTVGKPETAAERKEQRDRAYLIVLAGSNVGEMYKIDEVLTLGRGGASDVRLVDDGISRVHCRIRETQGDLVVEDLQSRNGTFCNGRQVTQQVLEDGDKIQLGRTTILKFTYHDKFDESFQKRMFDSALRDSLTKAYNKRYFLDRLVSELRFALRHRTPLSLLILDLDHFKQVNDTHGHLAGDHVLTVFAQTVADTIRNEDVFARYGGEEFAIILPETGLEGACSFGEKLRTAVEGISFDGEEPLTISVGVASFGMNITATSQLVDAADAELYRAKSLGRNRTCSPGSS